MKRERVRDLRVLLTIASWCALVVATSARDVVYEVEVRGEVKIPMSDGTHLATNIFLPKAEGQFPTVLVRSPYGKGGTEGGPGHSYASRGYVFVSQDCRGKGASEGEWIPFVNEARDGKDTHRWILDQPWSNGAIGTAGGSYVGYTQWASAPGAGEYLKAMFPVVPLVDPYGDVAYVGGAFQLSLELGWGAGVSGRSEIHSWDDEAWLKGFRTLPLATWDTAIGGQVQYLRDWVAHPEFDNYWAQSSLRGREKDITTPICAVGGWYDIFANSVLQHVNDVREQAQSDEVRKHLHVMMGPWIHGISDDGKVGEPGLRQGSRGRPELAPDPVVRSLAEGEENGRRPVAPLQDLRDGAEPMARRTGVAARANRSTSPTTSTAKVRPIRSTATARLDTAKPGEEPADGYVYDPEDPVPTLGGCNLGKCPVGPHDQTRAEQRQDVLVYTSDELAVEMEVTGPVKVVLYASSSATDTDWTAKLVDVHPDGRADQSVRRNPPRPLPRLGRPADADRAGEGLSATRSTCG